MASAAVASPQSPKSPIMSFNPPANLRQDLHYFWKLERCDLLARCILGEAEGEDYLGKFAVGCVIRNRVLHPSWWGRNYREVILKPAQFSCFNKNSHRFPGMLNPLDENLVNINIWADCVKAADSVLIPADDITRGANHYCTHAAAKRTNWAIGRDPVVVLGGHRFYRL